MRGNAVRPAIPPAPSDLSPQSAARWPGLASDVIASSGGAEVDFALLAHVLRAEDRLAQVQAILHSDGLTTTGSKGQTRPHPLLLAESVLRREVAQGFERLLLAPATATRLYRTRVRGNGRLRRDDDE